MKRSGAGGSLRKRAIAIGSVQGNQLSGAKRVAEKPGIWVETGDKHTSVAKAAGHSAGFVAGDKSPAYRPNEFFRSV